jgi:prolyl oligopeptidase
MLRIAREGGFRGTLEEYDALQLATIEKTFRSKEEMLAFARNVAKMMEPELPRLFGRLPDIPFGIRAVPADREASASNNYSLPPDSLGPGWVNLRTYQPETYTKGETASVTLHEGIPGHHLQNAIQRRLQDAPAFRRYFGIAAFSEGWALYAEGLADDIGFLQDPDSRYGRLSGDRFRSARLVVDTGMHAMGWTRERALNYFKQHAPQARWAEIDRYLEMPAQALGYKIGQLKFRELRTLTEQALGPRFDLRAFHDTVLRNGDLPFDLLEQQVQKHIELARATAKP